MLESMCEVRFQGVFPAGLSYQMLTGLWREDRLCRNPLSALNGRFLWGTSWQVDADYPDEIEKENAFYWAGTDYQDAYIKK